jgi:hypothetical protein
MELVRSDAPEVARYIASCGARASRRYPAFVYGCSLTVLILLITIVLSLIVPVRSAAWFGLSLLLAWNSYALWLAKSSGRNWCVAVCAERMYVRLYMTLETVPNRVDEPDVIVLEASEIASISIRIVELFLYGPKPKLVGCLIIEPTQAVADSVPTYIPSLLWDCETGGCCGELNSCNLVCVANEDGRLIIGWKGCYPPLQVFCQQVVQECPSLIIGREERSELDLNGIWHGIRENPDAHQRRMLVQAKRLGFGCECERLLSVYRRIPRRVVSAYMAEIEQEEAKSGQPVV